MNFDIRKQHFNIYSLFNKEKYIDRIILNNDKLENPAYFISSILYDIPTQNFFINGSEYNWEIIDGNKRLNAIKDFKENKFKLIEDFYNFNIKGYYYNDLKFQIQRKFEQYEFQANIINPGNSLNDINEIIKRIKNK